MTQYENNYGLQLERNKNKLLNLFQEDKTFIQPLLQKS